MGKKKSKKKQRTDTDNSSGSRLPEATEYQPANWYTIDSVEQLKSLANPFRVKLLSEFAEVPRTTKQVAKILGESPTKLYHHVDALAEHGLLHLVKELPKRGTTEKYFQAVARQFRVDDNCLNQTEFKDQKEKAMLDLLDSTKSNILDLISKATVVHDSNEDTEAQSLEQATAIGGLVHLHADEVPALTDRLMKMIGNVSKKKDGKAKSKKQSTKYKIAVFVYPDE